MSPAIQVFPKGGGASSSNSSISNSEVNVNNSATESLNSNVKAPDIDENSNISRFNQSNIKFSLVEDSNGVKYVKIDTEQNIFDNANIDEYGKTAKEYIKNRYKNVVVNETIINKTLAEEFAYSKSTWGLYKGNQEL